MKKTKATIKQIFDAVSELYGIDFQNNVFNAIPKDILMVKDEYGEFTSVIDLVIKEDKIQTVEFENGIVSKTAAEHLYFNGIDLIYASSLKINDVFKFADGSISKINNISISDSNETVYDLGIDTLTHLYQTSNGIIHHNTQRIGLLSKVLGIELITIEAPHIVEEHIINIPFIIFNPLNDNKKGGSTQLTGDEYKVELADSNLYSLIKHARKIEDQQYLASIYKSSKDVIELFEYFGGNETTIPEEFKKLRQEYNVILFLDEFFRQTSMRIRNMLRGILNNKIGAHVIPRNAYIVYATNLDDQGIDEIPTNTQFEHIEMHAPKKGEWFSWLVYKFQNDEHIKLKSDLINKFHHILEDEDLSHDDVESDVRTSPRRWEQLLLYVNEALPVKDEKDAKNLMSNIHLSFKNYLTGQHAELGKKVLKAVAELIKQTSNIEVSTSNINDATEWRDTLQHQIEMREKLGSKYRTYVPIISGAPGIGKCLSYETLVSVSVNEEIYNYVVKNK